MKLLICLSFLFCCNAFSRQKTYPQQEKFCTKNFYSGTFVIERGSPLQKRDSVLQDLNGQLKVQKDLCENSRGEFKSCIPETRTSGGRIRSLILTARFRCVKNY